MHTSGQPNRILRSIADGSLPLNGLVDIAPGTKVTVTAFDGEKSESQVVITVGG